ncbi:hypothetical protein IWQ61_003436 [Dispira simplex]|nr:hypothetical protein IWQ61_003436 [Dispira simplex]
MPTSLDNYISLDFLDQEDSSSTDTSNMEWGSDDSNFDDETVPDDTPELIRKRRREEAPLQPNHLRSQLGCIFERGKNALPPWLANPKCNATQCALKDVHKLLHNEIVEFIDYISPSPEEHKLREWVVQRVDNAVKEVWPTAEVKVFGSFHTHMYLPNSDIDLVVFTPDYIPGTDYEKQASRRALHKIARQLRKFNVTRNIEVIGNARVPIIKMVEQITHINVDISINMMSGVESAAIVSRFIKQDWPITLRALLFIIKQFLIQRGHNEVYMGGIGSYALTNLIVSFLQMHPQIQTGHIDPQLNLGVLLVEFFELYGKTFNYLNTGIRTAGKGSYFDKRRSVHNENDPRLRLCIEDPQDPSNNISRGTFKMHEIKHTFSGAFDVLTAYIYKFDQFIESGNMGRHVQRRTWSETKEVPPSDSVNVKIDLFKGGKKSATRSDFIVSFLAPIIKISPKCLKQRTHLAKVFFSGAMQKTLEVEFTPKLMETYRQTTGKRMTKQSRSKREPDHAKESNGLTSTKGSPSSPSHYRLAMGDGHFDQEPEPAIPIDFDFGQVSAPSTGKDKTVPNSRRASSGNKGKTDASFYFSVGDTSTVNSNGKKQPRDDREDSRTDNFRVGQQTRREFWNNKREIVHSVESDVGHSDGERSNDSVIFVASSSSDEAVDL